MKHLDEKDTRQLLDSAASMQTMRARKSHCFCGFAIAPAPVLRGEAVRDALLIDYNMRDQIKNFTQIGENRTGAVAALPSGVQQVTAGVEARCDTFCELHTSLALNFVNLLTRVMYNTARPNAERVEGNISPPSNVNGTFSILRHLTSRNKVSAHASHTPIKFTWVFGRNESGLVTTCDAIFSISCPAKGETVDIKATHSVGGHGEPWKALGNWTSDDFHSQSALHSFSRALFLFFKPGSNSDSPLYGDLISSRIHADRVHDTTHPAKTTWYGDFMEKLPDKYLPSIRSQIKMRVQRNSSWGKDLSVHSAVAKYKAAQRKYAKGFRILQAGIDTPQIYTAYNPGLIDTSHLVSSLPAGGSWIGHVSIPTRDLSIINTNGRGPRADQARLQEVYEIDAYFTLITSDYTS